MKNCRKVIEQLSLRLNKCLAVFLMIILPFLDFFYDGLNKFETVFVSVILFSFSSILSIIFSKNFRINKIDILILLYFSYGLLSSLFISRNISEPLFYFKWISILNLYFISRNFGYKIDNALVTGIFISIQLQAIIGILQYFDFFNSLNPNFKATGSFNNPGPFGIFLSIGGSVVLYYFFERWVYIKR